VRWTDGWLLATASVFLVLGALPSNDSLSISSEPPDAAMLPPDVGAMISERLMVTPFIALLAPIGFACPFLLGVWAGRRRMLERPEEHRRFLTVVAVVGIGIAAVGAQPVSLVLAGVSPVPDAGTLALIGPLHDTSGTFGGIGYAAGLALVAVRLHDRQGPLVESIAAVGQRSMTCYLAQSLVWTVVFTPFFMDLSGVMTVATTALTATGTWLATVLLAATMQRRGQRGPFELLARRVTYAGM
jgi:uncharacterized membrane protein YeiB